MKQGKLIVCNDEWPFSDEGFKTGDSGIFIKNILDFFTSDISEVKNHVLICRTGITYTNAFKSAIQKNGYKVTDNKNQGTATTESLLHNYDGIFLSGNPTIDNNVLVDYLGKGGCIYLSGGTGGQGVDAKRWNSLLKHFGLGLENQVNGLNGVQSVNINRPPFKNVRKLRMVNGHWITKTSNFSGSSLLGHTSTKGMFAVAEVAVREQQVELIVKATDIWLDTGLELKSGDQITITATGKWKNDGKSDTYEVTADGFDTYKDPAAILPEANFASLIGRVGESGTPFFVGSSFGPSSLDSGRLFLQMNDIVGSSADNEGELEVTVKIK
jgi:hypothetical protein